MATSEAPGICPSCRERPADTDVEFSEVVSTSSPWGVLQKHFWVPNVMRLSIPDRQEVMREVKEKEKLGPLVNYRASGRTLSGHVLVCAPCAASYNRSFTLREQAQRVGIFGLAGLVVCLVILLVAAHGAAATVAELVAGVVALASLVVILTGVWMGLRGAALHRTASRFLRSPAVVASAEQSDWSYNS